MLRPPCGDPSCNCAGGQYHEPQPGLAGGWASSNDPDIMIIDLYQTPLGNNFKYFKTVKTEAV